MSNPTKTTLLAALAMFFVQFNLGYVFHDLLFGAWFHEHVPFARDTYDVPLIALAFAAYALIAAHLYESYMTAQASSHLWLRGLRFGLLMGLLFDGLQGGLIEVATFEGMGFDVFALDSGYHVLVEGPLGGVILTAMHRWRATPADRLPTASFVRP